MRRSTVSALLIVAVLSTIVYLNTLDNGFHYDDEHYIVTNHFLERWGNIPALFTTTRYYSDDIRFTGHYRPLLYVTYALNKVTGGDNPFGYHIVNLVFHIGSAFLVFLIMKTMLGGFIPLASSLIFAVHPFNSEVVNYITARSSVMSGFFYLLSFYCWVKFRSHSRRDRVDRPVGTDVGTSVGTDLQVCPQSMDRPEGLSLRDVASYIASLLAFLLGMLSKEIVITLPIVLWLYDAYFTPTLSLPRLSYQRGGGSRRDRPSGLSTPLPLQGRGNKGEGTLLNWRTYLPYLPFILSVIIPYFLVRWIHYKVFTVYSFNRDIYSNILNQSYVLVKYIWMLAAPVGQSVYHDIVLTNSITDWRVIPSIIILAIIGIATFLLAKSNSHEGRTISFFSVWFFVTLLPTTLIPLNDIMQENRGYLSGVSFAVIAALFMEKFLGRRRWIFSLCLVLLLGVYSGATFKRNSIWQDEFTLWSDVLIKYPDSFKAFHSLGQAYMDQGENERAIEYFNNAIRIYPKIYTAYNALGIIYGERGDVGLAIAMFKKTIELRPDFPRAYYNLGTSYFLANNIPSAVENYKKALKFSPHYIDPYLALGEIYMRKGDTGLAEKMFKKVIDYRPSDARPYFRLGLIYEMQGKKGLAKDYYKAALKENPGLTGAKERLDRLGG